MFTALKRHWPEYLIEAGALGLFMVSACVCTILLYHPGSLAVRMLPHEFSRRILMGLAMGLTAVGIIYSPWGKRSGAHMNPAVTITFYRLGKVAAWDAVFYIIAQFVGGVIGVAMIALVAEDALAHPDVNYVATVPGAAGPWVAFASEAGISCLLVLVVLAASNSTRAARFTGWFAGMCVALFIVFEAPISGMSMNPARTFGSAFLAGVWDSLWIYFVAPPAGMLLGAAAYRSLKLKVSCAKMHHQNGQRCIFCEYQAARQVRVAAEAASRNAAPTLGPAGPSVR